MTAKYLPSLLVSLSRTSLASPGAVLVELSIPLALFESCLRNIQSLVRSQY